LTAPSEHEPLPSLSRAPAKPATGLGGLIGGLAAKKIAPKPADANSARTTFMTSTNEVLKVATDVTAADVAIPAGFKENK